MIIICGFEENYLSDLSALMVEMTHFYGASISSDMNIEDNVREQTKNMDVLLALHDGSLVGFATFKTLFPVGGLLSFSHIQQIYVGSAARRLGVARRLMSGIANVARSRGCRWVEWATAADNKAARAFYDELGAYSSPKIHYILQDDALEKIAQQ